MKFELGKSYAHKFYPGYSFRVLNIPPLGSCVWEMVPTQICSGLEAARPWPYINTQEHAHHWKEIK